MKIHHLPTNPAYCLDKLQKTKQGFQQQHVACQKKLQISKVVLERKRKEIAQMKRNLVSMQHRRGVCFGDETIRDREVMQQHFITGLERDIATLKRESKKLQKMSLVASKIVNVMEEEYQRTVLHNRSNKND